MKALEFDEASAIPVLATVNSSSPKEAVSMPVVGQNGRFSAKSGTIDAKKVITGIAGKYSESIRGIPERLHLSLQEV